MDNTTSKAVSLTKISSFNLEALTPEQVAVIKNTVAKGATDDELRWFLYQCDVLGLDPLTKEIWFIKRAKKVKKPSGEWDYPRLQNGKIDYTDADLVIMTSKDGYFKKATENPEFVSVQSMEIRENDDFDMEFDGEKIQVKKHSWKAKDRGKIIAAWACVTYKDGSKDWNFIYFDEYCQSYNGKPQGVWANNPTAMIRKCAETPLLKKAARLSGITTAEEMEHVIEGDVSTQDNSPDKAALREESIKAMIEKIMGCKNMEDYNKVTQEIAEVATGLLEEEVEKIRNTARDKKKQLEETPSSSKEGDLQAAQAEQNVISN